MSGIDGGGTPVRVVVGRPLPRHRVDGLLLDHEPGGERVRGGEGQDGVGEFEPGPAEGGEQGLLSLGVPVVGEPGATEDLGAVPVAEQRGAQGAAGGGDRLLPVPREGDRPGVHPAEHLGGHLVQQRLLVGEVPVQRGRLDVQLGGDPAQGEALQPGLVEQAQGGVDHLGAVQLRRHVAPFLP